MKPVPRDHGAHGSFRCAVASLGFLVLVGRRRKWLALAGAFDRWRKSTNTEEFLASEDGL